MLALLPILPVLLGIGVVSLIWPGRPQRTAFPLIFSLACGIGWGLTSCVFFIWVVLWHANYGAYFAMECLFVIALAGALFVRARKLDGQAAQILQDRPSVGMWTQVLVVGAFLLLLISRIGAFLLEAMGEPYGVFDAWGMWNLRARFLFRAGAFWNDVSQRPWPNQADYPLLLPLSVARGWHFAGGETVLVPILIGLVFTFGSILLMFTALNLLRNEVRALLASAVLMGTPYFIIHGARQCADVPLAFFILATVVLLSVQERLGGKSMAPVSLAGITCGLAAWTKNEGLLFLAAIIVARVIVLLPRRGMGSCLAEARYFLAGLIPVLAVILYFKLRFAPPNDLQLGHNLLGLTSPSRYYYIAKEFVRRAWTFGRWQQLGPVPFSPIPLLLGWFFCFGTCKRLKESSGLDTSFLALGIVLVGYFVVYLLTPHDLIFQVTSSCDRLFLQLWPAIVFLCFMVLPGPFKPAIRPQDD